MKKINLILAVVLTLNLGLETFNSFAQVTQTSLATVDRERMIGIEKSVIRIEEQLKAQQKEMDTRFEAGDDKLNKLYTLLYFILGGVFGLIGLIMWDRRSYIKPVKEDIVELRNALRDFAKDQPKLADILRSHGLM